MGSVYKAYDHQRQSKVAIKVMRRVTGPWIYRFKNEFRSLAGIVHPSFVFVDQSSNGSQLVDDTHQRRFVRRDEQRLMGEGTIILGPENSELVFPSLAYRVGWKNPAE
jgi:hypothetical protein